MDENKEKEELNDELLEQVSGGNVFTDPPKFVPEALLLFDFAMPARMTLQPSGGFCFAQKRRLSSSSAMASRSSLPEMLFRRVMLISTASQLLPRMSVSVLRLGMVMDHPS